MSPRDLPYQPLIRAALEKAGLTPEEALADSHWLICRNPISTSASRTDLPFLLFDADGGSVDWGPSGLHMTFRKLRNSYSFSMFMKSDKLPDAVVTGMVGKRLDKLIDVAGAHSMTIGSIGRDDNDAGYTLGLIPEQPQSEEPDI